MGTYLVKNKVRNSCKYIVFLKTHTQSLRKKETYAVTEFLQKKKSREIWWLVNKVEAFNF